MNERIEELWNKASFDTDSWEAQTRFIEKFAELIVRECADIATINQYQSYTPGHYILNHFGVA